METEVADNGELGSSAAGAMKGTAKVEIVGRICVEQVREWMEQRKASLARDGVLALDNYKDCVVAGRSRHTLFPSYTP